jgi:hypothetical protein
LIGGCWGEKCLLRYICVFCLLGFVDKWLMGGELSASFFYVFVFDLAIDICHLESISQP